MWSVWKDGVEHRLDDLPLAAIVNLERRAGVPLHQINPRYHGTHARLVADALGLSHETLGLTHFRVSAPDVPDYWANGAPVGPHRTLDGVIIRMCRPPWSFTPRQVREDFTLRDLELLIGSVDV